MRRASFPAIVTVFAAVTICAAFTSQAAQAQAQTQLGAPRKQKVTVSPPQAVAVSPKKPGKLVVNLRVESGFHINSARPHSGLLIPTRLAVVSLPPGVTAGKVTYPEGKDFALAIAPEEKLNVYAGELALSAPILLRRSGGGGAQPGRYPAKAELSYQACDDRQCYPPKTVPVEFEVEVRKP